MHILFLNQYFPPDPAPTGALLLELAQRLREEGHTVDLVGCRQNYHEGQRAGGRMFREVKALGAMLWDGLNSRRPDLVVSATSPPCLLVVATLVALRFRAKSIHWIMDLYPEIAVALKELSPGLPAALLTWIMRLCYRASDGVVVLDEDMAERISRSGVDAAIIRPWMFKDLLTPPASAVAPSSPWTWIYSGNLGRAHEWKTLLRAQALIESENREIRLLFQGGGPSWPAAQAYAQECGLQRCEWAPYVAQEELCASLLRCHCCVVSQLPIVQGMLWPSKLGLTMSIPRPLLWVGPSKGAIARELRSRAQTGIFEPGQEREIADWLMALSQERQPCAEKSHLDAQSHREASLNQWVELVEQI